jgi:hypothetical protein
MTYHILPRLKPGHTVPHINDPGTWAVHTRQVLDDLVKGLNVAKIESEINSIPDMWARPMLFEMALLDPDHVLHKRIRGEWRGLLAIIALKEVAKLQRFTVASVTVPSIAPLPDGEEESEVQQRDFVRTISKLLPSGSLATDTSWHNLHVFLFNGQPVGMTSPTTLVATAADYLDRISNQDVPWYNGTHLKDPIEHVSPKQKQILAGWISNLIAKINAHPHRNQDRWDVISGLLSEFSRELGGGTCGLSQAGLGIQGPGLFKYLDKPADGNVEEASHVQLIPSKGRNPAKRLLILDRSIAEQWDMAPQNVTVDGAQTLASAQVQAANAELWKSADFFTRKLFAIFQEDAFPETIGLGGQPLTLPGGTSRVTPILPLKWELLNYLNAEDLANCVRWDQAPEGIRIRLFLKLTGPNADISGRTIELSKLYRREDIRTLDNVPILEIWPNFKAEGWKAYYTCYSTDDATNTFTGEPYGVGNIVRSDVDLGGKRQRRYWRSENPPEGIICRGVVPNTQTNQLESQDAGILLLPAPPSVKAKGDKYKVGIDFGASSTTICARTGQNDFAVRFENRKTSVAASGDIAQARLFDFFLPRAACDMPVLSFFHDFHTVSTGDGIRAFLDGHAYLLEKAELFDADREGLAFDLKWSADGDDRIRVRAFLTQLCLQSAAELVANGASGVSFVFSYPTAFSDEQMEGFPGIWDQVTTECFAQSGLTKLSENVSQTESVASALYFVSHLHAATEMGTIFIDIGGSTSDISVWQGNHARWQTSVLLAGRSIFSNYLWYNPDFLGLFGIDVSQLHEVKHRSPSDRKPYHALTDVILRYHSDSIFQQLPVHAGAPQVKALRQQLALGVAGLFYYVGSLLQYLLQSGLYRKELPNVYVCGNGSRVFRWLDIDRRGQINALYKSTFAQGSGWTGEQGFSVLSSTELKKEAAFGLVANGDLNAPELTRKVISGESFIAEEMVEEWLKGEASDRAKSQTPQKMDWNTVLTPEAFTKSLRPPETLERLSDFMVAFNRFANAQGLVSPISLSSQDAEEIRRRLGQSLSRYRHASVTANIVVEPVFILALRHWLEIRLGG